MRLNWQKMPLKKNRDRWISLNRCAECGGNPPIKDSKLCYKCRERHNQSSRNWYKKNKARKDAYARNQFKTRQENGQCTTCGAPKNPDSDAGYSKCINCREAIHATDYARDRVRH